MSKRGMLGIPKASKLKRRRTTDTEPTAGDDDSDGLSLDSVSITSDDAAAIVTPSSPISRFRHVDPAPPPPPPPPPPLPQPKRLTAGGACGNCYKWKAKCDGQRPCERCRRIGYPEDCRDRIPSLSSVPVPVPDDVDDEETETDDDERPVPAVEEKKKKKPKKAKPPVAQRERPPRRSAAPLTGLLAEGDSDSDGEDPPSVFINVTPAIPIPLIRFLEFLFHVPFFDLLDSDDIARFHGALRPFRSLRETLDASEPLLLTHHAPTRTIWLPPPRHASRAWQLGARPATPDRPSLILSEHKRHVYPLDPTSVYLDLGDGPPVFDTTSVSSWVRAELPALVSDVTSITLALYTSVMAGVFRVFADSRQSLNVTDMKLTLRNRTSDRLDVTMFPNLQSLVVSSYPYDTKSSLELDVPMALRELKVEDSRVSLRVGASTFPNLTHLYHSGTSHGMARVSFPSLRSLQMPSSTERIPVSATSSLDLLVTCIKKRGISPSDFEYLPSSVKSLAISCDDWNLEWPDVIRWVVGHPERLIDYLAIHLPKNTKLSDNRRIRDMFGFDRNLGVDLQNIKQVRFSQRGSELLDHIPLRMGIDRRVGDTIPSLPFMPMALVIEPLAGALRYDAFSDIRESEASGAALFLTYRSNEALKASKGNWIPVAVSCKGLQGWILDILRLGTKILVRDFGVGVHPQDFKLQPERWDRESPTLWRRTGMYTELKQLILSRLPATDGMFDLSTISFVIGQYYTLYSRDPISIALRDLRGLRHSYPAGRLGGHEIGLTRRGVPRHYAAADDFEVRRTPYGLGLFAARDLPINTRLPYMGRLNYFDDLRALYYMAFEDQNRTSVRGDPLVLHGVWLDAHPKYENYIAGRINEPSPDQVANAVFATEARPHVTDIVVPWFRPRGPGDVPIEGKWNHSDISLSKYDPAVAIEYDFVSRVAPRHVKPMMIVVVTFVPIKAGEQILVHYGNLYPTVYEVAARPRVSPIGDDW